MAAADAADAAAVDRADRARGCVLGAFIGDAAGGVLEFQGRAPTAEEVEDAMGMPGGGVWRLGPGQITDDSEMALCLAHGLAGADPAAGPAPLDAIAFWYTKWLRSPPFDVGITTRNALSAGLRFKPDCPTPGIAKAMAKQAAQLNAESLSNGALMRASPLAVWAHRLPAEGVAAAARADASLTHPHPAAQDANAAYVIALAHLIAHPGDAPGAVAAAEAWARGGGDESGRDGGGRAAAPEVLGWLEEAAAPGPGPLAVHHQAGWLRWGFVHAFKALHQRPSFEEGMRHIISLGGDVDTNAAIVGAALGALHGASAIPERMLRPVVSRDESSPGRKRPGFLQGCVVEGLVERLWAAATGGGGGGDGPGGGDEEEPGGGGGGNGGGDGGEGGQ